MGNPDGGGGNLKNVNASINFDVSDKGTAKTAADAVRDLQAAISKLKQELISEQSVFNESAAAVGKFGDEAGIVTGIMTSSAASIERIQAELTTLKVALANTKVTTIDLSSAQAEAKKIADELNASQTNVNASTAAVGETQNAVKTTVINLAEAINNLSQVTKESVGDDEAKHRSAAEIQADYERIKASILSLVEAQKQLKEIITTTSSGNPGANALVNPEAIASLEVEKIELSKLRAELSSLVMEADKAGLSLSTFDEVVQQSDKATQQAASNTTSLKDRMDTLSIALQVAKNNQVALKEALESTDNVGLKSSLQVQLVIAQKAAAEATKEIKALEDEAKRLGSSFSDASGVIKFTESMVAAQAPTVDLQAKLNGLLADYQKLQTTLKSQGRLITASQDTAEVLALGQQMTLTKAKAAELLQQIVTLNAEINSNVAVDASAIEASKNLSNTENEAITVKERLGAALQKVTGFKKEAANAANSLTGAINQIKGASSGTAGSIVSDFLQLPGAFLGAASALTVFTAAVSAMGAAVVGSIAFVDRLGIDIRNFQNVTGASSQFGGILNLLAGQVGTSGRETNLSFGIGMQLIDQAAVNTADAIDDLNPRVERLQDKINALNPDHLQNLADSLVTLNNQLKDAADKFEKGQTKNALDASRRDDDYSKNRQKAQQTYDEALNTLEVSRARKSEDNTRTATEAKEAYEIALEQKQEDLQKKIADVEKSYADQRLSLWERFYTANPLLRPFIKSQIDALGSQQTAKELLIRNDAQQELDIIKEKYADEQDLLALHIARENEDYEIQQNKIVDTFDQRNSDLKTSYDRSVADAKTANDQMLVDYAKAQKDMQFAYDLRLRNETEAYAKQVEALKVAQDALDVRFEKAGKTQNAGVVKGLKDLGFEITAFNELLKTNPEEGLKKLARALVLLPASEQIRAVEQIFGYFGGQMLPLLQALGNMTDKQEARFKELYPDMIPSKKDQEATLLFIKTAGEVMQIVQEIIARFGRDLQPSVQHLLDTIMGLWGDDTKRTKTLSDIDTLAKSVSTIIDTISDVIEGKKTFKQLIDQLFPSDSVKAASDLISGFIAGILKKVIKFTVGILLDPQVIKALSDAANTIGNAIGIGLVDGVKDGLGITGGPSGSEINSFLDNISKSINNWGADIIASSKTNWDNIKALLPAELANIEGSITISFNNIKDLISRAWTQVGISTTIWITNMRTNIEIFKADVSGKFEILKNQIIATVKEWVDDISKFPTRLANNISSQWETLREAGINAFNGFRNGFTKSIEDFINQQAPFVKQIITAFNDAQQAHSPSLLWMNPGKMAGQGFIEGFKKSMEVLPTVMDLTASSPTYLKNSLTSNFFQIPQINVYAAAGQNPNDIASAIFRQISSKTDLRMQS